MNVYGDHAGGLLRKKLYDANLSDWSARYAKNRRNLESVTRDCQMLRAEVDKVQSEVDERADEYQRLEEKWLQDIKRRFDETKALLDRRTQEKADLSQQVTENRKLKASLLKEKRMLTADYERKHAELLRQAEVHDKVENQLMQATSHLLQLTTDRRRMERERDEVQLNLLGNKKLGDEVCSQINHVQDGMRDSLDLHLTPATGRPDSSTAPTAAIAIQAFQDRSGDSLDPADTAVSSPLLGQEALSSPRF
jgi:chromosome segregation ATPase